MNSGSELFATTICLVSMAVSGGAWAESITVTKTQLVAATCASCHGADGDGSKQIPSLRDLEYQDIVESMNGFKSGAEKATIMNRHAKAYSEEEIKQIAEYFSQKLE